MAPVKKKREKRRRSSAELSATRWKDRKTLENSVKWTKRRPSVHVDVERLLFFFLWLIDFEAVDSATVTSVDNGKTSVKKTKKQTKENRPANGPTLASTWTMLLEEGLDDGDGLHDLGQAGGDQEDDGVGDDEELHPTDAVGTLQPLAPAVVLCARTLITIGSHLFFN